MHSHHLSLALLVALALTATRSTADDFENEVAGNWAEEASGRDNRYSSDRPAVSERVACGCPLILPARSDPDPRLTLIASGVDWRHGREV